MLSVYFETPFTALGYAMSSGGRDLNSSRKSCIKVFNSFSRHCIVIFSSYSSEEIAPLLEQKVEQYSDRLVTEFKFQRISSGNADSWGYYSGIAVYGFRKKAFAKND